MHSSCVELAIHLASLEDEEDGREIIQSFIDKMEGMIVGARQAHYAFGNPTLVRYLCAQHAFCEMSWSSFLSVSAGPDKDYHRSSGERRRSRLRVTHSFSLRLVDEINPTTRERLFSNLVVLKTQELADVSDA
jgi:hypothetical protein